MGEERLQQADPESRDDRALEVPDAADHDHQERLHDVGRAEVGAGRPEQRERHPGDTGQAGPDEEGGPVGAAGRDADGLGEVAVADGRADLPPEGGEPEHRQQRGHARGSQEDDEEPGQREVVAQDRDGPVQPARRGHLLGRSPEDVTRDLLQDEADAVGDQQRVQRTGVHPPQHARLERQPEQPADHEPHGERDQQTQLGAGDDGRDDIGGVRAGHDELAVGHVDHAHLTEGQGEPEGDEEQDRTGGDAGEDLGEERVQRASSSTSRRTSGRGPARSACRSTRPCRSGPRSSPGR